MKQLVTNDYGEPLGYEYIYDDPPDPNPWYDREEYWGESEENIHGVPGCGTCGPDGCCSRVDCCTQPEVCYAE